MSDAHDFRKQDNRGSSENSDLNYLKPVTITTVEGTKKVISAYTNRVIKVYPGESDEKRSERLKRNFETARKNREKQRCLLESLKEKSKLYKEENEKISLALNHWKLQKLIDKNLYEKMINEISPVLNSELNKNARLYNRMNSLKIHCNSPQANLAKGFEDTNHGQAFMGHNEQYFGNGASQNFDGFNKLPFEDIDSPILFKDSYDTSQFDNINKSYFVTESPQSVGPATMPNGLGGMHDNFGLSMDEMQRHASESSQDIDFRDLNMRDFNFGELNTRDVNMDQFNMRGHNIQDNTIPDINMRKLGMHQQKNNDIHGDFSARAEAQHGKSRDQRGAHMSMINDEQFKIWDENKLRNQLEGNKKNTKFDNENILKYI